MIPRFRIYGTSFCFDDEEAEGWTIAVRWLGFVVEFAVGRFPRGR